LDRIENLKGSVIQHGPHNSRIYLMRLNTDNTHDLIPTLDEMAVKNGYGKIFAKIPSTAWHAFESADYIKEAVIPGFFTGKTDGFFIAKYFSEERQKPKNDGKVSRFVKKIGNGSVNNTRKTRTAEYNIESCSPEDAGEMSDIYRQIFKSYPFPIHEPAFLKQMMGQGVYYYCVRMAGRFAAIAAAETDSAEKNAEMTDFATLPRWRGMGLAGMLLRHMDQETRKLGIKTTYTIARADSFGMNSVFQKNRYRFAGVLKNNSQISGRIQDMTVWYKKL